jgi:hypothetical protein
MQTSKPQVLKLVDEDMGDGALGFLGAGASVADGVDNCEDEASKGACYRTGGIGFREIEDDDLALFDQARKRDGGLTTGQILKLT